MRKEDKTKFNSNIIELFDNVRSKSESVPDGLLQFKRIKFGENLRALFPCEIVRNNESCCISLDPSLIKHKHFIIVSTIKNLRRSEHTHLVDGQKKLLRRNPTKLLSLSKRMRLEVSYKDRFHQFGEDDFIVLGIFLDYKSSFSFNQDDAMAVMACKPNVCKPNSHFGSGGFVASFGTKASCGALGSNGKSIGQCACRKCLF